jgi:hypothetical protein
MSKNYESVDKNSIKTKIKKPLQNITKLQNERIIQKKLIYVIGLSNNLANKDVLKIITI